MECFVGLTHLAVAGYGAQLPRKKVVGWPRTADRHFAVLQLLSGGGVAVLVFFYALGVDQVGDVDQHTLGSDLFAADFFLKRAKQLVYLDGQSPRFGLALAFAGRFYLQLGQIIAADGVG